MSSEGDRRSRLLENHVEQHIGIRNTEAETTESQLGTLDLALDTKGNIFEKLATLLVFCLGLLACCLVFVTVIFSQIYFIQSLTEAVHTLNKTDSP